MLGTAYRMFVRQVEKENGIPYIRLWDDEKDQYYLAPLHRPINKPINYHHPIYYFEPVYHRKWECEVAKVNVLRTIAAILPL